MFSQSDILWSQCGSTKSFIICAHSCYLLVAVLRVIIASMYDSSQNISSKNVSSHKVHSGNVFEETWLKVLRIVFFSIMVILTAIANGLVLWALKRFVSLRKPGHIYLGGLAFADLCMIIPLVLRITNVLAPNDTVCVAQGITEVIFVCCVSLHLGCISIERYISIKFALRYDALVTGTKIYISIIVLWFLALSAGFLVPFAISADHFEHLTDGVVTLCSPDKGHGKMSEMPHNVFAYAVFMFSFFFCLPCAMILFSYTYIFIVSCRQRQKVVKVVNGDESRRNYVAKRFFKEFKVAKKLFLIQALFILTYFPYFAVSIVRMERDQRNERMLLYTSKTFSLLTCLTSCLNPIIYVSGNEQFKNAFKKLLRRRVSTERQSNE